MIYLRLHETDNRDTSTTDLILVGMDDESVKYKVEVNPMYLMYNALENLGCDDDDLEKIKVLISHTMSKYN